MISYKNIKIWSNLNNKIIHLIAQFCVHVYKEEEAIRKMIIRIRNECVDKTNFYANNSEWYADGTLDISPTFFMLEFCSFAFREKIALKKKLKRRSIHLDWCFSILSVYQIVDLNKLS
ncbi:hypothetical protein BpHYR1_031959 [Brachionus plicatilis]|uniref:Uncharacterized protein n=1 Tax=Brachionus plicatilis TaxID=10195 RepID=A0A3M7S3P3_BRAPC|nr:hypothetical protein BpHYR1_031959 [Brachionus plicatilis]